MHQAPQLTDLVACRPTNRLAIGWSERFRPHLVKLRACHFSDYRSVYQTLILRSGNPGTGVSERVYMGPQLTRSVEKSVKGILARMVVPLFA